MSEPGTEWSWTRDGALGLSRVREGFCVRKDEETIPYSLSKIMVKTGNDEGARFIAWELWSIAQARGRDNLTLFSVNRLREQLRTERPGIMCEAGGLSRSREGFCVRKDEET